MCVCVYLYVLPSPNFPQLPPDISFLLLLLSHYQALDKLPVMG